ncbi:hypothetical protein EBR66_01330 [bacterium]|nr:hypothetical protein [bacterium]
MAMIFMRTPKTTTYLTAFAITALVFATAFYISNYFNSKRVVNVRTTQDQIAIDILSLETQFDLLAEHSCKDIAENSVLSRELQPLGERLSYLENNRGANDEELLRLKRYYSLLEIKDILLIQKVAAKCKLKPVVILYFYSNTGDCKDCERQGYVLTALAEKYPTLRVYSFDYNLDLSALKTLTAIHDLDGELPALVIQGTPYYGFKSIEDMEKIAPALKKLPSSTSTKEKQ